jgi:hypothetical protein
MVCSICRSKLNFVVHYCSSYVLSFTHSNSILTFLRQGVPEGGLAQAQETLRQGESCKESPRHHSRPVLVVSRPGHPSSRTTLARRHDSGCRRRLWRSASIPHILSCSTTADGSSPR